MLISDLVCIDRILVGFEVEPGGRAQLFSAVAHLFARQDPQLDQATIVSAFEERERMSSTNMGAGVALPHAVVRSAPAPRLAVCVCERPFVYGSDVPEPVRLVAALLTPEWSRDNLEPLVCVARTLRQPAVRDRLLRARLPQAALDALLADPYGLVAA